MKVNRLGFLKFCAMYMTLFCEQVEAHDLGQKKLDADPDTGEFIIRMPGWKQFFAIVGDMAVTNDNENLKEAAIGLQEIEKAMRDRNVVVREPVQQT